MSLRLVEGIVLGGVVSRDCVGAVIVQILVLIWS